MSSSRGGEPMEDEIDRAAEPPPPSSTDHYDFLNMGEEVLQNRPILDKMLPAIYRVPREFLDSDKNVRKFYKPKVVSIGPYHNHMKTREKSLRPMEALKWACLYKLIDRHHPLDESHEGLELLGSCFSRMIEQREEIQKRYSERIKLNDRVFARMMLLDGGFILYLLLKTETEYDLQPIIGRVSIWYLVKNDLLLLENQIPFFVIRDLCDILVPDDSDFNLVRYALKYFSSLHPCRKQAREISEDDVLHLLHLVYLSVLPCPQKNPKKYKPSTTQQWIPSVTKLKEYGVKFKKRKRENKGSFLSFLDIKFNDGVMEIPHLRLHDYSVSLFRNLVAFEQCHPNTNCDITAYVAFMNCLIDEEEDRRSLHLDKILISSITTEKDATHFFRRLYHGAQYAPYKNYLRRLINDVNQYHRKTGPQTRAYMVRTYFINPATTVALIGGIIAFVLSAFDNILSINENLHGRK